MSRARYPVVLLLLAALVGAGLLHPAPSEAAPGDVDLEVTVTGTYGSGLLGLFPGIEWTITLTNSTADSPVGATATGVVVRDTLTSFSPNTPSRTGITAPAGTTYSAASGNWSVSSLAPGASLTLRYQTNFGALTGSTAGTVAAEVTAQGQSDLDSAPAEDADIGNQDDEAVWRTGAGNLRVVGDRVWSDLNVDGRYGTGEPGVRGVQVIVTSSSEGRIFAGRTDASGIWSYSAVATGSRVTTRFVPPKNFVFTLANAGDDAGDSDADPGTGTTEERTIGSNDLDIDAGFRPTADLSVTKSVTPASGAATFSPTFTVTVSNAGPVAATGVVLSDAFPAGSALVGGSVTVTQGTSFGTGSRTWSVGTLASGATATMTYRLQFVNLGSYSNRAQIVASSTPDPDSAPNPAATLCSANAEDDCATATVTVTGGTGSLAGTVWLDLNGDGQRQATEPRQAGVTVRRLSPLPQASTTTTSTGAWSFAGVPAGSHVVEVVPPGSARFTAADAGADATDSDFPTSGQLPVVVSTGSTTTVDAGLVRAEAVTADAVLAPQSVSVTFNVLDNDAVPGRVAGGALPAGWSWNRLTGPAWGSVTCQANGSCTYLPVAGFAGSDGFRYSVTNPLFGATTAEVNLQVLFVNDPPVARNDRAVTAPAQAVSVDVLANDEDANDPPSTGDPNRPGDPLTVSATGAVSPAGAGVVDCRARTCTFSPASSFTGIATFGYSVTDSGRSDPRVGNAGVPGGVPVTSPRSAEATVRVWVDPNRRPPSGFTTRAVATTSGRTGSFSASVTATASASCSAARPQVTLGWEAVPKATGYRVERQAGSGGAWVPLAVVAGPALGFTDTLVGEGQSISYRVTPLRHRLVGQPSLTATVTTPPVVGTIGCS